VTSTFEQDGVEGLRVGRFNLGISSTCIVYRIGKSVIDTAPPNQWARVRRFLQEHSIQQVMITHHHEDHSGNGARLQREMDAGVYLPASGVDLMRRGFPLRPYQHVIWGAPERFVPQPVPSEIELENQLTLRSLATPGHSPDMTCYLEPHRSWLFTGDLYIASKPRFMRVDENVDDEIESLRRVLDMEFGTLFCAHRGIVADGPEAIRAKLDYLVSLRERVRELRREGRSISEITRLLLGREKLMSFITLFHFSKRNLVRACLGGASRRLSPPAS
jgi:glyoxylase-like metal-dependent hydrolase (beta-lactamase superfamily II)